MATMLYLQCMLASAFHIPNPLLISSAITTLFKGQAPVAGVAPSNIMGVQKSTLPTLHAPGLVHRGRGGLDMTLSDYKKPNIKDLHHPLPHHQYKLETGEVEKISRLASFSSAAYALISNPHLIWNPVLGKVLSVMYNRKTNIAGYVGVCYESKTIVVGFR